MNGLNLNLVVIALTIIALVAIAYSKNDLAEKAVAGLSSLAGEAIKLLRQLWK